MICTILLAMLYIIHDYFNGFPFFRNGEAVAESYVIVWDVRYLRNNGKDDNVWTVPIASPPLLLHFLPAFSGRAVASAGDGHVALLHINDATEKQAVFQVIKLEFRILVY